MEKANRYVGWQHVFHSVQSYYFYFSLHLHFSGNEKPKLLQNCNGGGRIRLGSIYDCFSRATTIQKQKIYLKSATFFISVNLLEGEAESMHRNTANHEHFMELYLSFMGFIAPSSVEFPVGWCLDQGSGSDRPLMGCNLAASLFLTAYVRGFCYSFQWTDLLWYFRPHDLGFVVRRNRCLAVQYLVWHRIRLFTSLCCFFHYKERIILPHLVS